MTFSPLTLFCLLPRVALRPRRGQRRSSASGFPGARSGGSPERSGDRPALPHRLAAPPGQQRCRRSPHGETQPGGGRGEGMREEPGTETAGLGVSDPRRREVEVRMSASPWLVASPGRRPPYLGRVQSCCHKGRFVAWAPHFPPGARPPLGSSSSELPPCLFPSLFPLFPSLLPRAPFPDRVNIRPAPTLDSGYL